MSEPLAERYPCTACGGEIEVVRSAAGAGGQVRLNMATSHVGGGWPTPSCRAAALKLALDLQTEVAQQGAESRGPKGVES